MPLVWRMADRLAQADVDEIAADPRAKSATVSQLQAMIASVENPLVGIFIFGSGDTPDFVLDRLSFPLEAVQAAPRVTPQGTSGSTSWSYAVVPRNASGRIAGATGAAGSTASGANNLGANRYNLVAWDAVTGAASYDVYRTAAGGNPNTLGRIGSAAALSFGDHGAAGDGATAPTQSLLQAITADLDDQLAAAYADAQGGNPFWAKTHFWQYLGSRLYVPRWMGAGDYAVLVSNDSPPANWWQSEWLDAGQKPR